MFTTILLSYSAAFGLCIKEVIKANIKAGLNMKSGGQPGGKPKFLGAWPHSPPPVETPLEVMHVG